MKFKDGDRVRAIAACDGFEEAIDECGEIRSVDTRPDERLQYLVKFDKPYVGVDDDGLLWCEESSLVPEDEEA